jgi:hypothetical protein
MIRPGNYERAKQAENPKRLIVHDVGELLVDKPPPRQWILGRTFCCGFLSGLTGRGAIGKTALRYLQYISVATGRPLTGEHVHKRTKVLIVSLEDDLRELHRRLSAAAMHHKVARSELSGWLYCCTPRGLKLMRRGKRGGMVPGELKAELVTAIKELGVGLIGIDPFVKLHDADENDNGAIDQVVTCLVEICEETGCVCDYVHHHRKGSTEPGDADSGRGASSLKDGGRLIYTVSPMSEDEAKTFDIETEKRRSMIRVDDAKFNLGPPQGAVWFRIVGVKLDNSTADYPDGDNVQTVERWQAPDMWANLTRPVVDAILDQIERGMPDEGDMFGNGPVRRYSGAKQAKDRAAWRVVQEHVPGLTEPQAQLVIETWIRNGMLTVGPYRDMNKRRDENGLFVAKRPGAG